MDSVGLVATFLLAPWGGSTVAGVVGAGLVAWLKRKSGGDWAIVTLYGILGAAGVVFLFQSLAVPSFRSWFAESMVERSVREWVTTIDSDFRDVVNPPIGQVFRYEYRSNPDGPSTFLHMENGFLVLSVDLKNQEYDDMIRRMNANELALRKAEFTALLADQDVTFDLDMDRRQGMRLSITRRIATSDATLSAFMEADRVVESTLKLANVVPTWQTYGPTASEQR